MIDQLFVGVDGGATKCTVRVEDATGRLIGQATSGPANIRISVEQAWKSINSALEAALQNAGLSLSKNSAISLSAGMGLAGCEIPAAKEAFQQHPHRFHELQIISDAHAACLGAHGGQDGAIIIIGTGVVGFQLADQKIHKVGGWGFPHDDLGGGAWIGLEATKVALQHLDGRLPASGLSNAVLGFFEDSKRLVQWANEANSTAFATLAPIVISQSQLGDAAALDILRRAANEINRVGEALNITSLPCSLIGGIAPLIEPYLNVKLRSRLQPCKATPDVGAILLMRNKKDV